MNISLDIHWSEDNKFVTLSAEEWQKVLGILKLVCEVDEFDELEKPQVASEWNER